MNFKAPIVSLSSVAMIFSPPLLGAIGLGDIFTYGILYIPVVMVAWSVALVSLALRERKDWLTILFAAFTLGVYPTIALLAGILWLADYAWPVRFWSARSLLQILRHVWYLWGVPTLAAVSWIAWNRRAAVRRLKWFQIASLASIAMLTFPSCVVSIVSLADWPLVCVMGPLSAALCWTTFSWMRGHRFRAARPLRLVADAILPTAVIFASVPHLAPGSPERWPTCLAFRISSLGVPFLLLSLALFSAPDPDKRKRRRRPAATLVTDKNASGLPDSNPNAAENVR